MTRRRSGSTPSCVAVMLLAGAAGALVPSDAWSEAPEIVARVNGEPVTRAELERMLANPLTLRQARDRLGDDPESAALEGLAYRRLIHLRLLIQEARRRGIEVTDEELDAAMISLRRRFDDLRSFGVWMKEQGLDDGSLFETVRAGLAADRVRAALVEGVRVSEEDVRLHYDAHRDDFRREEVRLQLIAVTDEGAAKEIVAALRSGEKFGRVARERSRGLRAAQGGDTGWIAADGLAPPIREIVAKLKLREAWGPLRRGSDLLVLRLSGRREGGTKSLADVRADLERRLLAGRQQATVEAWLTEQERTARIEMSPPLAAGRTTKPPTVEAAASTVPSR